MESGVVEWPASQLEAARGGHYFRMVEKRKGLVGDPCFVHGEKRKCMRRNGETMFFQCWIL